jgi:hypothetical protein
MECSHQTMLIEMTLTDENIPCWIRCEEECNGFEVSCSLLASTTRQIQLLVKKELLGVGGAWEP